MKDNEVYMICGTQYKQMAIELLETLDLASDIGDRAKRVGLKPNILNDSLPSYGATTHPQLVDGTLEYLKRHGFWNLVVLESSWIGAETGRSVRATGIWDVCQRHGVSFLDLKKDTSVACDAAGMQINVCKEALKLDYFINLPVVKGHCQTTVTCALKNCKGLIPDSEKRRFHTMGLHKPIAHLNTVIHQDFILADNICGDLDFEEGGNPVVMNRILGLKDPVLCDSFAAEIMGYRPNEVEYLTIAQKLGVGSMDTANAKVIDISSAAMEPSAAPQPARRVKKLAQYVSPKDACSACYGSLIHALGRLDEEGALAKRRKGNLAVGQGYRGQCGKIGIGQCTHCFEKSVGGCPPKAVDIVQFLRKEW